LVKRQGFKGKRSGLWCDYLWVGALIVMPGEGCGP